MNKNAEKICPKNISQFECCIDNITNCNCSTIVLDKKHSNNLQQHIKAVCIWIV
jgi:hypothetical protein